MWIRPSTATGSALEELTFSELVEFWAENEIDRQLREVELFSSNIVAGAARLGTLRIMPERGGFYEDRRSIEVLVEVRDFQQRCTRIGAWREKKFGKKDERAFDRAYAKATAHAIIQLLPAAVWRTWIDEKAS